MNTDTPNTVPLTCPHCQQLDSYTIPPTLVTCKGCGEAAHVLDYDVIATGQGDANFALPMVPGEVQP